ncbi:MAG: AAA family ATPase [Novosphingobium sp.]|uniref:AAA family ATPase n=1 Tax=Novosphingobium sp. TaxID=1874826 RepID=UPI0032B7B565
MQRILIIGSPGAGKSTLARSLAERTGLPLHHLDQIHWLPGWVERDRDEERVVLDRLLAQDHWIIDGNYGSTLPQRIARADTVVWLDYPTALCLRRVLTRWWLYRSRSRPDMPADCPERIDLPFLRYVLTFRGAWAKRNAGALARFAGQTIRLRNSAQTQAWLAAL